MLDIRDLKDGDELECIESFSDIFKTCTRWFHVGGKFVVSSVYANAFMVDDEFILHESKLKFFKKKEDKTPHNFGNAMCDKDDVKYTFDDLIKICFDAKSKGFIEMIIYDKNDILSVFESVSQKPLFCVQKSISSEFISDCVNAIQSMCHETFVIECEDDLRKIRDCQVTLANGNSFSMKNIQFHDNKTRKCLTVRFDSEHGTQDSYGLLELKGATVEQKLN